MKEFIAIFTPTQWKQELPNYQFEEARVTTVKEISVNLETTPPTAIAEFNVAVSISNNGARIPVRRFVKVYFMKKDGKWMVRDYEHFDAAAGFSNLGQQ